MASGSVISENDRKAEVNTAISDIEDFMKNPRAMTPEDEAKLKHDDSVLRDGQVKLAPGIEAQLEKIEQEISRKEAVEAERFEEGRHPAQLFSKLRGGNSDTSSESSGSGTSNNNTSSNSSDRHNSVTSDMEMELARKQAAGASITELDSAKGKVDIAADHSTHMNSGDIQTPGGEVIANEGHEPPAVPVEPVGQSHAVVEEKSKDVAKNELAKAASNMVWQDASVGYGFVKVEDLTHAAKLATNSVGQDATSAEIQQVTKEIKNNNTEITKPIVESTKEFHDGNENTKNQAVTTAAVSAALATQFAGIKGLSAINLSSLGIQLTDSSPTGTNPQFAQDGGLKPPVVSNPDMVAALNKATTQAPSGGRTLAQSN